MLYTHFCVFNMQHKINTIFLNDLNLSDLNNFRSLFFYLLIVNLKYIKFSFLHSKYKNNKR